MRICRLIDKISDISNFDICGLRFMLDGKFILSTISTFFFGFVLSKQFETLFKCYRHTVNVHVPF